MELCHRCKKNLAMVETRTMNMSNKQIEKQKICFVCAIDLGILTIQDVKSSLSAIHKDIAHLPDDKIMEILNNFGKFANTSNINSPEIMSEIFRMLEDLKLEEMEDDDSEGEYVDAYDTDIAFGDMESFGGANMLMNSSMSSASEESESNGSKSSTVGVKNKKNKNFKALKKFGTDLIDKAKQGQIDNIVGREKEVDRVIQILNRRQKNNPLLLGEPGVGKTAIAEGLAVRIAEGKVPEKLLDVEIYLLDMTEVVAGTQFRGQFEQRMKDIIKEATKAGNVILVIDEVHSIIGAGDSQGGSMNAANILKPALAKGEIQLIGATTLEEYRKHIEKDSALERRFQPVRVDEPSIKEAIEILMGIKKYYENHHKVQIEESVVEAAVKMSARYIPDRFLPDKAIDLIDEAGSKVNLKNTNLTEQRKLQIEYDKLLEQHDEFSQAGDYAKAAEIRAEFLKIKKKIDELETIVKDTVVTVEDIASVVEAWTKIPVAKITQQEAEKLLALENSLHARVIGQSEAVSAVARAVRRARSGFKKRKKPASFMFVGPTGVGKTELAKALSSELFGEDDQLIRLDMSEYMEKHAVSKLIGAPPGYVGFDNGGQLTERVRRKPYSVILLDEIEKAHPDIYNTLLQILDDGRLTDSQGRTVFFENTIIVMTSNLGTSFKQPVVGFGETHSGAISDNHIMEKVKENFRPEFLNRVDEIVIFKPLTKDELYSIVDIQLDEIKKDMADKHMTLEITDEAKKILIDKGFNEKFGARPLRRTIQSMIEDEVADMYIKGIIKDGDKVVIAAIDGKITITAPKILSESMQLA